MYVGLTSDLADETFILVCFGNFIYLLSQLLEYAPYCWLKITCNLISYQVSFRRVMCGSNRWCTTPCRGRVGTSRPQKSQPQGLHERDQPGGQGYHISTLPGPRGYHRYFDEIKWCPHPSPTGGWYTTDLNHTLWRKKMKNVANCPIPAKTSKHFWR